MVASGRDSGVTGARRGWGVAGPDVAADRGICPRGASAHDAGRRVRLAAEREAAGDGREERMISRLPRGRRGRRGAVAAAAGLAWALTAAAPAQTVTYNGMLGDRALLVIDGRAQAVAVGATTHGLKLVRVDGGHAQVEIGGKLLSLQLGGSFQAPGGEAGGNGSRIVLAAGPGGHFVGTATINGHAARFMVDTGATAVSIGRDEADRLGLDYAHGGFGGAMTANGPIAVRTITLTTVRVGDVLVADVPATVVPQPMPYVLLGNSFLARFRMERDNDTMVLEKKN